MIEIKEENRDYTFYFDQKYGPEESTQEKKGFIQ